jgi:hypothetical protein
VKKTSKGWAASGTQSDGRRPPGCYRGGTTLGRALGGWYWIGVCVGLGAAAAVLLAGLLGAIRFGAAIVVAGAVAAGALIGLALGDLPEAVGGAVGGVAGSVGSAPLVRGALARGGTRGGTALIVALAAAVLGALALIPVVGYLEAVVLPALGLRARRRAGDRYAGLRVLARD